MPSGLSNTKRSWAESNGKIDGHPSKRPREEEEPRDWKDVYLKAGGRRREKSRESHGSARRESDRERDRYRASSRDKDKGRERDRYRPDSRRDGRKRHERDKRDERTGDRDQGTFANGHARDSEREEGEISPALSRGPTPKPPMPSAPTNFSTGTSTPSLPLKEPETEMELELDTAPKPVEETISERRARRQAIRAKYTGIASAALSVNEAASPSPGLSSAVSQPPPTPSASDLVSQNHSAAATPDTSNIDASAEASGRASPVVMSPDIDSFDLAKKGAESNASQPVDGTGEQISAADYDPSLDRREDEEKRVRAVVSKDKGHQDVEIVEIEEEEEEDVDDMFALDTTEKKTKKVRKVAKPAAPALITTTLDTAADVEGYYQIILGEQLDGGRYQVFSSLGKGMFANVVRARILQGDANEVGKEVAIKIVRSQESMFKAGLKEAQILNKLKQADPEDKKHVVRLERTFEHRGHLCLVFESLSMNLRDVVKRFGKDVGLNIQAVRAYTHQLFLAMSLLRKCNIMHADIKPDNILANEQKTVLKVCDLGSASDASENEITPYLVSRFYRAPEIIMGVPYDCSLDIWSIGCTLYELYTGKILFPGRSNNQMLLLMMELKGRFNSKMIKKAKFGDNYFDDMGAFESVERDRVTGTDVIRKVHLAKPSRDLRARLLPSASKASDEEAKLIMSFIDLLDKCLMLDPARRITPKEALAHSFIRG
ncbi:kinase-like domain-containing protein [Phellopilus nigrolimitatus]|nr:kinase-like domain-containing protein [Phellopilus nigrolimitatus]